MLITHDILVHILASTTHLNLWSKLNFKATAMTTFSDFLRCREFTIQAGKAFDPSIHITRNGVQFMLSISAPSHVVLTVPSSKTDTFRKGVAITIASTPGACICAVAACQEWVFQSD